MFSKLIISLYYYFMSGLFFERSLKFCSVVVLMFCFSANAQVPASMQNGNTIPSSLSSIDAIKQSLQNSNLEQQQQLENVPANQPQVEQLNQNPSPQSPATESVELPKDKMEVQEVRSLDSIIDDPEKIEQAQEAAVERQQDGEFKKQTNISAIDDNADIWKEKPSPQKSDKNLLRIKYDSKIQDLSDADKLAINSMLKIIKDNKIKNIVIKSHSSKLATPQEEREMALSRVLVAREYLKSENFPEGNIKYKILGAVNNKFNLNFIDVDKE